MRITLRLAGAATTALAGLALAAPASATTAGGAATQPALGRSRGTVAVVVQATPGGQAAAAAAVRRAGGVVGLPLPIVGGFAARVAAGALSRLAAQPGVRAVSLDRRMRVQAAAADAGGPPSVYRQVVGADRLAATGADGRGVTVALIDTGVAPMADLAGRVVAVNTGPLGLGTASCVNFSGESGCGDSYGHGTFIAGLIAGSGAASSGRYAGAAPGARVLSVKIAGRDGSADVSKVLAAIQWVVAHRLRYGVRVLNLSLGTDSAQSYRLDPLNYAVEQAWRAGIVVVVAASNRGPAAGTISKPGDDPYVVTVGAVDDRGTVAVGDDVLPNFSGRGPTVPDGLAKPDVVAPGAHVVSLAAPGSAISTEYPSSMAAPYRRGSGTSMATGIVSGLAADLLSAAPQLSPDRVKYALLATARPAASADRLAVGAGEVDGFAAGSAPPGISNAGLDRSTGLGSLAGSRGSVRVSVTAGLPLAGTLTGQLKVFLPLEFTQLGWSELTWPLAQWTGDSWYGDSWYGNSWYGDSWYGNSWYGRPAGDSWYGNSWYGGAWYGAWDR